MERRQYLSQRWVVPVFKKTLMLQNRILVWYK
jgi:hypothetical protein